MGTIHSRRGVRIFVELGPLRAAIVCRVVVCDRCSHTVCMFVAFSCQTDGGLSCLLLPFEVLKYPRYRASDGAKRVERVDSEGMHCERMRIRPRSRISGAFSWGPCQSIHVLIHSFNTKFTNPLRLQ